MNQTVLRQSEKWQYYIDTDVVGVLTFKGKTLSVKIKSLIHYNFEGSHFQTHSESLI